MPFSGRCPPEYQILENQSHRATRALAAVPSLSAARSVNTVPAPRGTATSFNKSRFSVTHLKIGCWRNGLGCFGSGSTIHSRCSLGVGGGSVAMDGCGWGVGIKLGGECIFRFLCCRSGPMRNLSGTLQDSEGCEPYAFRASIYGFLISCSITGNTNQSLLVILFLFLSVLQLSDRMSHAINRMTLEVHALHAVDVRIRSAYSPQ